ncbi:sarcosine oxidase subunit gamma [Aliihoeflea aestuarii]|jgi:methylglutamate dehydrogenase subunit D|uniref:sarcosine oxidase subunit gamma family protein n=1 Tax=Aliihoeflea aestuarii TaxID=453840 RepID=UPI0020932C46|nr:sarcosine oxidase subunit gamma family protein [Aliihoeflea aestuarii]MCO6390783.1 sarcosine oxidase subunit gamma [Aliihoeflea aestuarii]
MVEIVSALEPVYRRGAHGNRDGGSAITLWETQPGSIVQVTSWPGKEGAALAAINAAASLDVTADAGAGVFSDTRSAFGFAPGRWLMVDQAEGMGDTLRDRIDTQTGTVTDLSHGRTAIAIEGERAEWVLSKLFALDFSLAAFPVSVGKSTAHHEFFTLIQRTATDRFDLYVYRSFARSFWQLLCTSAEEVGYTVD